MTPDTSINDTFRRRSRDAECARRSGSFDPDPEKEEEFAEKLSDQRTFQDRQPEALTPLLTVGQSMTRNVRSCRPDDTLASAAAAMCEADCRFLPVVDRIGHPTGVVTDGDICLLGATDHRRLRDIFVREGMSGLPAVCRANDNLLDAVKTMRERRIRHLPVVNAEGVLEGVLSLTDVVLRSAEESSPPLRQAVAATLRAIVQKHGDRRAVRHNPFIED
jgi:CBS domain-containing protein